VNWVVIHPDKGGKRSWGLEFKKMDIMETESGRVSRRASVLAKHFLQISADNQQRTLEGVPCLQYQPPEANSGETIPFRQHTTILYPLAVKQYSSEMTGRS
jgi:hypothetical protein